MLIVRSVQENDLDALFELIQKSEYGLTTLKISKEALESRIEKSLFAFKQKNPKPDGQPYVFVMEDLSKGHIVGTCSIYSKVGGFEPLYHYKIEKSIHASEDLDVKKSIDVLHLQAEHDGPTEIGSLFLSPDYWGSGHGRLLSLSRFLFMAEFSERFEKEVIAEMRGVVDGDGRSPLWSALGSYFFQIDFPKAETLSSKSKKFIADLMPRHPIYIPLLPDDAQGVIGKVHRNTRPALSVLEKEGFEFRQYVDIFDGGPTIHCELNNIRAIRESRAGKIVAIAAKNSDEDQQLVSNCRLDYRTCLGTIVWTEDGAELDEKTALRLGLKVSDRVRSVTTR
jgi:arginine N-succinyltransferase